MLVRLVLALLCFGALHAQELRVQVLSTTDVHGHVMAEDTFSMQPRNLGWAKLATLIRQRKALNPNTILVDSGDTIQGEPINYVRHRLRRDLPDPSMPIMNDLGYAAMAVGNHEFDFGLEVLREVEKQAKFPWICANAVTGKDAQPAFKPFVKVKVGEVTVGILGLVTPQIPRWSEPECYEGLNFEDIVASAKVWVPRLREKEKVDVVLVAVHSGLGEVTGEMGDENAVLRLADQVPGIDAILSGHTHRPIVTRHKGVPILQAHMHGLALGVLELVLRKEKSRWTLVSAEPSLLRPADDTPIDPTVLALTAELREGTRTYLDTFATNLQVDLDTRFARMEDSPVLQLLHRSMREATGAQLTAAACFNTGLYIPKGPTSVRQWYALLPYENRVVRIKVTGRQLKAYLEHAARYYNPPYLPELTSGQLAGYDFDMVDGVNYALDLMKPVGQRVVNLRWQGQPVAPDQTFTLALTSYRFRGGGGFMDAMGWSGAPELVTAECHRNLLLDVVLKNSTLNLTPDHNWRTIPYLDRERVLQGGGR
ncbi:MAG TPA: bifunctional UDP-sugar hydrolase/5'-nucleotidase [Holophagaceae bacterium]|nr:bifunctional UDP-sugar hydrolase/5'-nucleotidase [Holophagaceae bacterium]